MSELTTKDDCFNELLNNYGYPENVCMDLCNWYSTDDLIEFIDFLKDEREE